MLREEESRLAHSSDIQLFHVDHQWQVLDNIAEQQAASGRYSSDEVTYRVAVRLRHLANSLDIVLVCEVEDEHIVRLPVDRLLNSVQLVRDERGEQSNMPHPCNNIVPVSIPQVQVRFLREKKRSLEPVRGENLGQFSEKDLDKYTSDDLALILQINHKDPASLDSVKNSLFRQRVCLVKQSRFHQNLESGSQSFADTVMATPRLHCLDQSRESQISPSLKILPDSGEDFGRSRRQIQGMTQDPCYRSQPEFGHREV